MDRHEHRLLRNLPETRQEIRISRFLPSMCTEHLSACTFCGFNRLMNLEHCDYWIWNFRRITRNSGDVPILQWPGIPDPKKCPNYGENIKIQIRPGACPRGPPKSPAVSTDAGEVRDKGSATVVDDTEQEENKKGKEKDENEEEEMDGCPGYAARKEIRSRGGLDWHRTWGHRALRHRLGLPEVPNPGAFEDLRKMANGTYRPPSKKVAGEIEWVVERWDNIPDVPREEELAPEVRGSQKQRAAEFLRQQLLIPRPRIVQPHEVEDPDRRHRHRQRTTQNRGQQGAAREEQEQRPGKELQRRHSHYGDKPKTKTSERDKIPRSSAMPIVGRPVWPRRERTFNGPMMRPH